MGVAAESPMTADAFIAWAMARTEPGRFELVNGEPVAMAPERKLHVAVKARVWRALDDAVRGRGRRRSAGRRHGGGH